jgi:hypothetical protein
VEAGIKSRENVCVHHHSKHHSNPIIQKDLCNGPHQCDRSHLDVLCGFNFTVPAFANPQFSTPHVTAMIPPTNITTHDQARKHKTLSATKYIRTCTATDMYTRSSQKANALRIEYANSYQRNKVKKQKMWRGYYVANVRKPMKKRTKIPA